MPESDNVSIRKFEGRDRADVRRIAHDTAFMGESAANFFDGEKIISDALTLYYTDYEPQSCFVAEAEGRVIGYLIGAKDKALEERVMAQKINSPLLRSALVSGILFKQKNITFIFRVILSILKGEFKMPAVSDAYPATFHINLEAGFCGRDIGSRLAGAYFDYLRIEGIRGVHIATYSENAAKFFAKQGFELIFTGKRSYFRHLLHKDIPLYIYARKL